MLVVVLAAAAFRAVRALPQSGPSPVLSARQEVVTNAGGITKTVQQKTGPNTAVTIGATVGVIVGFIALVIVGIWFGSWRRKKNKEWQRSMAEAQQETKNLNRLTMRGQSVPMTPTSSIGSTSKVGRKSSALSLTPSTTSSFASSGANNTTPPHEQRRPTVLHQPTPRTPSNLVQNSLLHQHSEYPPPPPPSNDRPDALSSTPPDMNRTSLYAQQPARPSPLHNSVTLPPSQAAAHAAQPAHSFEPPSRHHAAERDAGTAPPPSSRSPPSFQPPQRRKSRADVNLTIVIPPSHHQAPRVPPGLENGGDASANSLRSADMGRAL